MTEKNKISVQLNISADEFVRYYSGSARKVLARSIDGQTVQFPANILQRYVTHDGIHGLFTLYFDRDNRFISIEKSRQGE